MTRIICTFVFVTLMVSLFCSCGSVVTFKKVSATYAPDFTDKIFISTLQCNESKCLEQQGEIHQLTHHKLKKYLQARGLTVVEHSTDAQVGLYLVSTFEKEILPDVPRNLYLMGFTLENGKRKNEFFQAGLARAFSDPLTKDFGNSDELVSSFMKLVTTGKRQETQISLFDQ